MYKSPFSVKYNAHQSCRPLSSLNCILKSLSLKPITNIHLAPSQSLTSRLFEATLLAFHLKSCNSKTKVLQGYWSPSSWLWFKQAKIFKNKGWPLGHFLKLKIKQVIGQITLCTVKIPSLKYNVNCQLIEKHRHNSDGLYSVFTTKNPTRLKKLK